MKNLTGFALMFAAGMAHADDDVTLYLKWLPQAQFAGYYAALQNGYYDDAGLNVTIIPGGSTAPPPQALADGTADVVVDWMPSALAAREDGIPMVNIAQPFNTSGLMLTCRASAGIASPDDFAGKRIGLWQAGNELPFLAWMSMLDLPLDGGDAGVTLVEQDETVDLLLNDEADCVSTMSYNEYWRILDAGVPSEDLVIYKYDDFGVSTMEDGLYVLDSNLDDPEFLDRMARFVSASMQGWDWARENAVPATDIVMQFADAAGNDRQHQLRMMREINKLTQDSTGILNPDDYQRTVETLLAHGGTSVISAEPVDAWTHKVSDLAFTQPEDQPEGCATSVSISDVDCLDEANQKSE